MDIRLGRLKMPIENSHGYYELPSGDVSHTIQPSPIEKPLLTDEGNNCQSEKRESPKTQEEGSRYNSFSNFFLMVETKNFLDGGY